jgi:hypothetical protein
MTMTSKQRSYYSVMRTNKYIKGRPGRAPGTNTKGPEGIGRFPKLRGRFPGVQEGSGRLGKVCNRSERIWEASGGTGKDGRASNKKAEVSGVKGVQGPGAQGPG